MIKLTPEELDVFKDLSDSELGTFLAGYFKKVQDHAYDSRNWDKEMTPVAAKLVAKLIQEHLIDKIRPTKNQAPVMNQHE